MVHVILAVIFMLLPFCISTPVTTVNPDYCLQYTSYTLLSNDAASLDCQYVINNGSINIQLRFTAFYSSTLFFEAYSTDTFSTICNATTTNPHANCTFNLSETHKYELQLRTSLMPEGFNMLSVIEENGQFTTPNLNGDEPCYSETNPYNDGSSFPNVTSTTQFCCRIFA